MVTYGWHYAKFIQEAKRKMDAGAVGDIEFVMCHMASPIRSLDRICKRRITSSLGRLTGEFFAAYQELSVLAVEWRAWLRVE